MNDTELTAWAATLMGWKRLDRIAAGWGDGPAVWETLDPNAPTFQGFDPIHRVEDDYLVLRKIVTDGNNDFCCAFRDELRLAWEVRTMAKTNGEVWGCIQYLVGDYTRAAYAAVSKHAQEA